MTLNRSSILNHKWGRDLYVIRLNGGTGAIVDAQRQ